MTPSCSSLNRSFSVVPSIHGQCSTRANSQTNLIHENENPSRLHLSPSQRVREREREKRESAVDIPIGNSRTGQGAPRLVRRSRNGLFRIDYLLTSPSTWLGAGGPQYAAEHTQSPSLEGLLEACWSMYRKVCTPDGIGVSVLVKEKGIFFSLRTWRTPCGTCGVGYRNWWMYIQYIHILRLMLFAASISRTLARGTQRTYVHPYSPRRKYCTPYVGTIQYLRVRNPAHVQYG